MIEVSREDRSRIVHLYIKYRQTIREIAAEFPFSTTVVRRILLEEGVQLRRGTQLPERREKRHKNIWKQADTIVSIYRDQRKSLRQVAVEFGCTATLIKEILKAKGVKTRTLKEARRYRPDKYGYAEHQQVEVARKRWQPEVTVNRKMSVQQMRDKELTIDEIASITGMSRVDVFKELQ